MITKQLYYKTTPRPRACISCCQGARVPAQSEVVHSLVNDDGPAGDVDLSQEGGQVIRELSDDLTISGGQDVPEVAHMSLS